MYENVRSWVGKCQVCTRTRGTKGVSPYVRTEFYSRPFRALQFDTISCSRDAGVEEGRYVLTCICCFSRWCWLIPLKAKTAEEIAYNLLTKVMLDVAGFPVIVRSDNAPEFTGEVVRELNRLTGTTHLLGTTYHPQSQGMVESMHKTINQITRALVEDHPEDWLERLPFVQNVLRTSPVKALGGRSPYEVVLGLKFKTPASMLGAVPVEERSVNAYVESLRQYLEEAHAELRRKFESSKEEAEDRKDAKRSGEIKKGDLVLVKKEIERKDPGPSRFKMSTYKEVFRVVAGGPHAFHVRYVYDPKKALPFSLPLNAERLIRLDMPELELDPAQPRLLQMLEPDADPETGWTSWRVERHSPDGLVQLQRLDQPEVREWFDLSEQRYRWLLPGALDARQALRDR